MVTIRQLIESLMQCEDLDELVVFEYYTKDHFEHTGVSNEVWAEVAEAHDGILTDDDKYSVVEHAITEAMQS